MFVNELKYIFLKEESIKTGDIRMLQKQFSCKKWIEKQNNNMKADSEFTKNEKWHRIRESSAAQNNNRVFLKPHNANAPHQAFKAVYQSLIASTICLLKHSYANLFPTLL